MLYNVYNCVLYVLYVGRVECLVPIKHMLSCNYKGRCNRCRYKTLDPEGEEWGNVMSRVG